MLSNILTKALNYTKLFLNKLVLAERSCEKLTLSFCLGLFFALSPFIGLQTWMAILFCLIFRLNTTVAISTLYVVNNPFTMAPIFFIEYKLGYFILNDIFYVKIKSNPAWIDTILNFINKYLFCMEKYLANGICFWCFFIGSMVASLVISIVLYPIMKKVFNLLLCKKQQKHENNITK